MKYIITALDNSELGNEINKEKDLKILCKDIQYQEAILEILEKYKNINFLIISELLPGKYNINELINKIKEKNKILKIIIILENKKEELENLLYSKGVYKIFYNNEIEIKKIINILKNDNEKNNEENIIMKNEINKIKKILMENNIEINLNDNEQFKMDNKKYLKKLIKDKLKKNVIFKKIYKIKNNIKKKGNLCTVISVLGTGGVGKSIVTINLAKALYKDNKKILIIDFDILNNSLHTILGVDKYSQKIKNKKDIDINNLIIKINNKLDLISGINLLFDSKYKISCEKIKNLIENFKKYYDYIIIDNSSECFLDYTKNIIRNSNFAIFLLESNLLEINKSKNILNIYIKKWNVDKEKIKLLINKYNKNSIDENIIKNIFKEYKILGKINFNEKYNLLINENFNNFFEIKNINKEYKEISKIIKKEN